MKILVDENIPSITVHELRSLGHDVLDVRGTPQQGIEDADLWRLAQLQGRLLITTDKGFAEIERRGITVSSSFVFDSRMKNAFTPEPWPGFGSSRRENGQDCFSLFEIRCRA